MHFMCFDLIFITVHKDMFYLFHFIKKRNETERISVACPWSYHLWLSEARSPVSLALQSYVFLLLSI